MYCNMRNLNYSTLPEGSKPSCKVIKPYSDSVDTSELARLLKLVYVPDKRTGLPTGELSVLASDKVSPEIANWVRTQLLQPIDVSSPSSIVGGTQLSDDVLLSLTRNSGESDRAYIDRVDSLLRDWNKEENKES